MADPVTDIAAPVQTAGDGLSRRRLPPAERERQIVDGAIRYFAEVGFEGQTRELARRLGITQPLLFRYFPTKDDLIDRVYEEVYLSRWKDEWPEGLKDRSLPLEERLVRYYEDYGAAIFNYEWVRIFMFSGLKGEPINRRFLQIVREKILCVICAEVRHDLGLPSSSEQSISSEEIDLYWSLQGSIFYVGVREWAYQEPAPADLSVYIRRTVRTFLGGIEPVLRELLADAKPS
ncbi:MAG: AcrR family transcriptional regulator [Paracoccaceae bacterium]|jgi:AcrR family transcriptional regulator